MITFNQRVYVARFGVDWWKVLMPWRPIGSMRVAPNCDGSEFIFTLLRQPGMSDEQFKEDKQAVEKDLTALKALLNGYLIACVLIIHTWFHDRLYRGGRYYLQTSIQPF